MAMSRDGKKILSAGDSKVLKLWDAESGACLKTMGEGFSISALAVRWWRWWRGCGCGTSTSLRRGTTGPIS